MGSLLGYGWEPTLFSTVDTGGNSKISSAFTRIHKINHTVSCHYYMRERNDERTYSYVIGMENK
jgi:hypothetical protein